VKTLEDTLKRRAALDQPARTWGGRVFYCEPPREIKGKWRTFAYKMINTLIQGSAADNTKEAMIRYDEIKKDGELDLQIHDELLGNAPKSKAGFRSEMKLLREAMESVEFDVPMLTDGEAGPTWGQMQDYNDMREAA
jgi:DNA polymerase I-like protein with 3'-5' exonuclease and polymerase domains